MFPLLTLSHRAQDKGTKVKTDEERIDLSGTRMREFKFKSRSFSLQIQTSHTSASCFDCGWSLEVRMEEEEGLQCERVSC